MGELLRETYSAVSLCPSQTLQMPIKEDVIVPDSREDVGRILQCAAVYMPGDSTLEKRRLRFEGSLEFTVLYIEEGEDGKIHSLKTAVPVEESVNLEGILSGEERVRYQQEFEVENVRATLLNSRKISLGALLETQVRVSTYTDISVVTDMENEEDLQLHRVQKPVRRLIGDAREKLIVREVVPVKDGDPNIAEMLWWDSRIKGRRYRLAEDRMEIKGEVGICILYRSALNDEIQFRETTVPFTGSVECPGAREGQIPQVQLRIVKNYIRTAQDDDGEERLFETEVVMEAQVQVYEEETRQLVSDAYHIHKETDMLCPPCPLQRFVYCGESSLEVIRGLEVPEHLPDVLQIFYTAGRARVDDCTVTNDQVLIEGVLYVTVFYLTASDRGPLASFTDVVPFSKTLSVPGAQEGQSFQTEAWVETVTATSSGGRNIELRAGLILEGCGIEEEKMAVLTELSLREPEKGAWDHLPSAALCFVGPDESLWEVAKRLHVKQEQMERINDFTVLAVR